MVIVNDLPYVKSVLIEAQAGLWYNSADLGTLAAAVHLAVDDPQLLRRSRENALRFAREQFNWQIQAKVLYALYNSQPGEGMPNPADLRPEMNPRGRRTMVDGTA
jgi:glycosyltransferase involved in cell wall biosynthesis